MKSIKMLGLVVLTALTTMAIGAAAPAIAEPTGLCGEDVNPCESVVTHVHETSVGKAKLLTSVLTVECEVLFLGDVTEGAPAVIKGTYTYSGCSSGCTIKEENGPAVIEFLKEGHETASVTGGGLGRLTCPLFGVECAYKLSGLKGQAKGPLLATQKNGEVTFTEQALTKEGGLSCPSSAKLDIKTTPLTATYIQGQMRCDSDINAMLTNPTGSLYICGSLDGVSGTWKLINR
jgi:hypothetical protein